MARGTRAGGAAAVLLLGTLLPAVSGPSPRQSGTAPPDQSVRSGASGPTLIRSRLAQAVTGTARSAPRGTLAQLVLGRPVTDCGADRCVALTFDDGPGPDTDRLLEMLSERGARATFFVVGRLARDNPATIRRIAAAGHELGNHTWGHPALPDLTSEEIRDELERTQRVVRDITGRGMTVMRPPYGSTGRRVAREAASLGLAQILWSADTFDWRDRSPRRLAKRAAAVRPGDIVLMHDVHRTTVDAVPKMVDELERRGMRTVTVSEMYGSRRMIPGREYHNGPDSGLIRERIDGRTGE